MLLLGMATTLMAGFFMFFSRQAFRYARREELVGNAERALARIQARFGDSDADYTVLDSTINGFYFPTAEPADGALVYDSSGKPVWQAWLGYGRDATSNTLYEARQAFGSDTVGKLPSLLPALWSRRTLAFFVTGLTVTGPTDGAFSIRLVVRHNMDARDNTGYQTEFVTTVRPQN